MTTLLERANGVPLYLEELPKPVLEPGDSDDGTPIALPATLRDSLMAQLDRLGEAKAVAQTAAVLGHSFERPLLEYVWDGGEQNLETGLATLTDAALINQDRNSATCGFRHALLAEIAYDSLLRDDRRRIHRKTAEILAKHFRAVSEARPELLAWHYESAGSHRNAFDFWLEAGKAAARRSANVEAIEHLKNAEVALEEVARVDARSTEEESLALYLALGPVLIALSGWSTPSVENVYRKAFALAESLGVQNRNLFDAYRGLSNVYLLRGDLAEAESATVKLRIIADGLDDQGLRRSWHRSAGICDFLAARFAAAIDHLDGPQKPYDPREQDRDVAVQGVSPTVIACSFASWAHWFLGNSDASDRTYSTAVRAAEQADHAFSLGYALCLGASVAQCRGTPEAALDRANAALQLSIEHQFTYWQAWASIVKGWARVALGERDSGLSELQEGLDLYRSINVGQMYGYSLCLLADAHQRANHWEESVDRAREAIAETKRTGIVFYQPEAYRILGEGVCKVLGRRSSSIRPLIQALRIAEQQRSKSLSMLASDSLLRAVDRRWFQSIIKSRTMKLLDQNEPDGFPPEMPLS